MPPSEIYRPSRREGRSAVTTAPNTENTVVRSDIPSTSHSPSRHNDGQSQPDAEAGGLSRQPSELTMSMSSESWVEVSSRPSSSSLSSIGGDEIVTTGLRVGSGTYPRRRRPQNAMPASFIVGHSDANTSGATSSQDEYEESESEEDRVMTSSNEAIHPTASTNLLSHRRTTSSRNASAAVETDSDSDDDDDGTALGPASSPTPVFRPQPNAFSHPPSHMLNHSSAAASRSSSYPYSQSAPSSRPVHYRSHNNSRRSPPDFLSPSYQADNDAALRASLTTLLSCAAAARSLPKYNTATNTNNNNNNPATISDDERRALGAAILPPTTQPMELRLVPESELMAEHDDGGPPPSGPAAPKAPQQVPSRTGTRTSTGSSPALSPTRLHPSGEKSKRSATVQSARSRGTGRRKASGAVTLERNASQTSFFSSLSPSVLTWAVSAGVVVLVSVVGFGAGYMIGREVGRQEGAAGAASFTAGGGSGGAGLVGNATSAAAAAGSGCGSELVKSSSAGGALKRIRWVGVVGKGVAA